MDDPAVVTLLSCHDVEEKNNEQLKPISSQKKQALEAIKKRMIQDGHTCKRLNEKWYVVIEQHNKKPKLNPATITILLDHFLRERQIQWTQEELDAFAKYIDVKLSENTTTVYNARITNEKPLKMFLNKV
jgi:hypothetical protein